jgi:REP element-mobilizing transposase RayT
VESSLSPDQIRTLDGRWEPLYRSQLHYLVTWQTRGRRPVLKERHARSLQALIRGLGDERGFSILEIAAAPDHVHLLLALRPTQSVASVIRELKGRCGPALLDRYPELRVWLKGNLLWDERYAVETVSAARIERVRERLRSHHGGIEPLARAS